MPKPNKNFAMMFTKPFLGWPWIVMTLICCFGAMFSLTERLVLVHSEHYPRWLRTGALAFLAPGSLNQLRNSVSGGKREIDIFEKKDEWVFRCGDFWPTSKTFTAPRSANNDRIVNSPEAF